MRYQLVPETARFAHVVLYLVPVSDATTVALAPVLITARILAVPEALERRFTPHRATFVEVAPYASWGATNADAVNASAATRRAGAMSSRLSLGRKRPLGDMGVPPAGARAQRWQRATTDNITPMDQSAPAPWGQTRITRKDQRLAPRRVRSRL